MMNDRSRSRSEMPRALTPNWSLQYGSSRAGRIQLMLTSQGLLGKVIEISNPAGELIVCSMYCRNCRMSARLAYEIMDPACCFEIRSCSGSRFGRQNFTTKVEWKHLRTASKLLQDQPVPSQRSLKTHGAILTRRVQSDSAVVMMIVFDFSAFSH